MKNVFSKLQINYKITITLFLHLLFLLERFIQNKIKKQNEIKTI